MAGGRCGSASSDLDEGPRTLIVRRSAADVPRPRRPPKEAPRVAGFLARNPAQATGFQRFAQCIGQQVGPAVPMRGSERPPGVCADDPAVPVRAAPGSSRVLRLDSRFEAAAQAVRCGRRARRSTGSGAVMAARQVKRPFRARDYCALIGMAASAVPSCRVVTAGRMVVRHFLLVFGAGGCATTSSHNGRPWLGLPTGSESRVGGSPYQTSPRSWSPCWRLDSEALGERHQHWQRFSSSSSRFASVCPAASCS